MVECRICNREVAGSNLDVGYFTPRSTQPSIPPGSVNEYVPAAAGKAKAGMAHSDCRWTRGCAGKTVKSLENKCHTWALLRRWFSTKRRYIKCMHLYLYLTTLSEPLTLSQTQHLQLPSLSCNTPTINLHSSSLAYCIGYSVHTGTLLYVYESTLRDRKLPPRLRYP